MVTSWRFAPFEIKTADGKPVQHWAYDAYFVGGPTTTVAHSKGGTMRKVMAVFSSVLAFAGPSKAAHANAVTIAEQAAAPGKRQVIQDVDAVAPPNEMWRFVDDSDAVVRVRIVQSHVEMGPRESVLTKHDVELVDVVKRHPSVPMAAKTLTIAQRAGVLDLPDRTISVATQKPFTVGEEYVLFLKWNQPLGCFEVAHGAFGAFKLQAGTVKPVANSQASRSVGRADEAGFIDTLRLLAKR